MVHEKFVLLAKFIKITNHNILTYIGRIDDFGAATLKRS
jgi:hypothetical protein